MLSVDHNKTLQLHTLQPVITTIGYNQRLQITCFLATLFFNRNLHLELWNCIKCRLLGALSQRSLFATYLALFLPRTLWLLQCLLCDVHSSTASANSTINRTSKRQWAANGASDTEQPTEPATNTEQQVEPGQFVLVQLPKARKS